MSDSHPVDVQQSDIEQKTVIAAKKDLSLKGTFVSVLLLGGFIAVSWIGVFVLFIARN